MNGQDVLYAGMVLALVLSSAFLSAGPPKPAEPNHSHFVVRDLSPTEITDFEDRLQANPKDLASRVQLLVYYNRQRSASKEARAARLAHALWVIEHRPESRVAASSLIKISPTFHHAAYERGRGLWLGHVAAQLENPTILGNAAHFVFSYDWKTAEKLFLRAETQDPENPEWPRLLGALYRIQAQRNDKETDKELARKSVAAYGRALPRLTGWGRMMALLMAARTGVIAEDLDRAEHYAREALTLTTHIKVANTDALHDGNLVLGQVALRRGKLLEAEKHLLAAGRAAGSTNFENFGPDMGLARELLERNRREVVIEYLELCRRTWKEVRIDLWIAEIQDGRTPDLEPTPLVLDFPPIDPSWLKGWVVEPAND